MNNEKCNLCGKKLKYSKEQVATGANNVPVFRTFGYCESCGTKIDLGICKENDKHFKKEKKKDSALSIVSALLSFFTITCYFGVIVGIIDLLKNKKDGKRHIGSWFGIVFGIMLIIVSISNNNKSENTSVAKPVSQVATQQSSAPAAIPDTETAQEEVPIYNDEILFRDIPWGTNYTEVSNTLGELGLMPISGDAFKTYSTDDIALGDYKGINFERNDINIAATALYPEIDVAGYTASGVSLYFSYIPVDGVLTKTENDSALYGARYEFEPNNLSEMSQDLINKLTSMYGTPAKETTDKDIWKNKYTYIYWYGQNNTEIVLKLQDTTEDTSDLYNDQIFISYIWRNGDEFLQTASDILEQNEIADEAEKYGNGETTGL